jgi:hypothetical protein
VVTLAAASASSSAAPGTLAFIIVFGMAVILVFLFRSMSKHLRKVDKAAHQQEDTAAHQDTADDAGDPARAGRLPGDS